ncbi:pyridoxamine 5'-phosphate oxidase [Corynespora cassiicola Philippines]|uniref:pyridoxal 5'-phosphate synthase n=1 Tax=Corynespora cassiicola Philippines TaxID=1448308 RepID=A0A2T2N9T1_CORCC|nr:pyridoxamine 5'-phosphate oxidase [Corynespora cassiicola Philippines]
MLAPSPLAFRTVAELCPRYIGATTLRLIHRPTRHLTTSPCKRYSQTQQPKMLHSANPPASQKASDQPPPPSHPEKRIFAPTGGSSDPGHAVQYAQGTLSESDLQPTPTEQFHSWFQSALASSVYQPETVTLATASLPSGKVSARIVFMKELDSRGFVVYSNWDTSRKAADVASNPHAALTFWWREVERQVRVEGTVERLSEEESQVYYDTRIRGSRIGAWASPQSKVLDGREELERRVEEVEKRFEGQEKIPVPPFWGGLRVVPEVVEFWQGRQSRLHDRFRYTKEGEGWKVERLSP